MKGVILAGGLGTRLRPLTNITNKHLLPVYDRPMIYYPLEALAQAGIREVMVVTGGTSAGDFFRLLQNGEQFGLPHLHYAYQSGEGGIADALRLAHSFTGADRMCVILGDNIVERSIRPIAARFERQERGAHVVLTRVKHPQAYGVADIRDGRLVRILEKPKNPPSHWIVTGIYFYDSSVYDVIATLKPSKRGELEITDVNNAYIRAGAMGFSKLKGWWADCGEDLDGLLASGLRVARTGANKPE
jgi:glucose-1-phosphate thymidylyltransferase